MVAQDGIVGSAAVARWAETLEDLHRRTSYRFARSEARERVKRYLVGLLGRVERKNGWQLAEATGERDPQGVQRLLNSAGWEADEVRDDLREYVVEHLGDEETGVLIVDEAVFLKKGDKSVGLARQYTGTAGDTVNCQVGCSWPTPRVRRLPRVVPEEFVFRNKAELAEEMLGRAFGAGVPARWVVADSFYGRLHSFRERLEERARRPRRIRSREGR